MLPHTHTVPMKGYPSQCSLLSELGRGLAQWTPSPTPGARRCRLPCKPCEHHAAKTRPSLCPPSAVLRGSRPKKLIQCVINVPECIGTSWRIFVGARKSWQRRYHRRRGPVDPAQKSAPGSVQPHGRWCRSSAAYRNRPGPLCHFVQDSAWRATSTAPASPPGLRAPWARMILPQQSSVTSDEH